MKVNGCLGMYLPAIMITLIFSAGMALGSCPCNDVDQSIPNADASSVSSSSPASTGVNNPPNKPALLSGPNTGRIGRTYRYATYATDPDGDKLKYTFDWGDGKTSETGSVKPGTMTSSSHTWSKAGMYQVKVMATDSKGASSIWSSQMVATIS